jgi:hypothetical protein
MVQSVAAAQSPVPYPFVSSVGRDFFFPLLALAVAVLFPMQWIIWSFVVVGHAHFLMAYLYQYRAGKMNIFYLVSAGVLLAISLWYFLSGGDVVPVFLVAGILFSVHFAIDEFTLHSETFTRHAWFSVASFAFLFSWLVLVLAPASVSMFAPVLLGASVLFFVVRLITGGWHLTRTERYLLIIAVILSTLALAFNMPNKIVGVVLLLHFANWYVGYGARLKQKPERARVYWIEVIVTLALVLAFFVPFYFFGVTFLAFLFIPAYYYAWAIAHIILSFVSALPKKSA